MDTACMMLGRPTSIAICAGGAAGFLGLKYPRHLTLISVTDGMHDQIRYVIRSLTKEPSSDGHACWYSWEQEVANILRSLSFHQVSDCFPACLLAAA